MAVLFHLNISKSASKQADGISSDLIQFHVIFDYSFSILAYLIPCFHATCIIMPTHSCINTHMPLLIAGWWITKSRGADFSPNSRRGICLARAFPPLFPFNWFQKQINLNKTGA